MAVQWEADGADCQAEDKSFAGGPDHQAEDRPDRKSGMARIAKQKTGHQVPVMNGPDQEDRPDRQLENGLGLPGRAGRR